MGVGQELVDALVRRENGKVGELLARLDGVTVNEASALGLTPLHAGCWRGDVGVVAKVLTIPGVNVNARNNNGWTAIMYAAAYCKVEALRMLVDHPVVDVNARNKDGVTAIMLTAAICHLEALRMLVDHPAVDMDLRGNNGRGVEEMVGVNMPRSTEKSKCLDMITEARRKRENISLQQEQPSNANAFSGAGNSAEEVRARVMQHYIDQIEEINLKIKEREKKMKVEIEVKNAKMKALREKQEFERKTLATESNKEKSKLEQQLSALQQSLNELLNKNRRKVEEMNRKHQNEKRTLENKLKKESEEDRQLLARLKDTTDELARDLRKLDLDPANDATPANMEALKDTLECPVCMEIMRPPTRIWMCSSSHLVCEDCKEKIEGRLCPTCRTETINLRALMAENFSRTLFNN